VTNALQRAFSFENLHEVWAEHRRKLLRSCAGVDRRDAHVFSIKLASNLAEARRNALGAYQPHGLLAIPKRKANTSKYRVICVPTVSDRIIQFALQNALRKTFERLGLINKVSFGVARGREFSVLEARKQACRYRSSAPWVYKSDIESFFDSLPRDKLKALVKSAVRDRSFHPIMMKIIDTEIADGYGRDWRKLVDAAGVVPGIGIRQGMPLSPFFAALFLRKFDRELIRRGIHAVRYVDDFVVFFENEADCHEFHRWATRILCELDLSIGPINTKGSKTKIYAPDQPADFLGMEISQASGGKYRLLVSEETVADVCNRVDCISTIEDLLKKGILLTNVDSYVKAMTQGFISAYADAENSDEFESQIKLRADLAKASLLKQIFGPELLQRLTPIQRDFIGIPTLSVDALIADEA